MLPMVSMTSWRLMPMPLSATVRVPASWSTSMRMRKFSIVLVEALVGERLEAELLGGIGGVGDQLPQEDLLVRVQRADHQVQDLADLCLELQGFFMGIDSHGWFYSARVVKKPRAGPWPGLKCHTVAGPFLGPGRM